MLALRVNLQSGKNDQRDLHGLSIVQTINEHHLTINHYWPHDSHIILVKWVASFTTNHWPSVLVANKPISTTTVIVIADSLALSAFLKFALLNSHSCSP